MSGEPIAPAAAPGRLVTVFERLFESEFLTLERFAISCRTPDGMRCLDETTAVTALLAGDDSGARPAPADASVAAVHRAMYAAWPEVVAVVSGPARHLRSLMAEGCALPDPTSMMRKRGVTHLADHVLASGALDEPRLAGTLARAREIAAANGMRHVLLVEPDGTVHVAGRSPEETMAHYSNVEFSARVECARIDEAAPHPPPG